MGATSRVLLQFPWLLCSNDVHLSSSLSLSCSWSFTFWSLNGSGHRAAVPHPQHSLQSVCLGKLAVVSLLVCSEIVLKIFPASAHAPPSMVSFSPNLAELSVQLAKCQCARQTLMSVRKGCRVFVGTLLMYLNSKQTKRKWVKQWGSWVASSSRLASFSSSDSSVG